MGWRSEHWTYAIWSAMVLGGKLFSSPSCTFFPHPPVCVRIRRTTNRPGSALVASRGTPSRRVSALEYDTTLAVRLPEAEAPRARLVCPNGSTSKNPSWVLKCVIGVSYRFVMSFEKFRVFRLFFFWCDYNLLGKSVDCSRYNELWSQWSIRAANEKSGEDGEVWNRNSDHAPVLYPKTDVYTKHVIVSRHAIMYRRVSHFNFDTIFPSSPISTRTSVLPTWKFMIKNTH